MTVHHAAEQIKRAVLSWERTEAHPHRFGGTEYCIGKRELGHFHGNGLVDIPFHFSFCGYWRDLVAFGVRL